MHLRVNEIIHYLLVKKTLINSVYWAVSKSTVLQHSSGKWIRSWKSRTSSIVYMCRDISCSCRGSHRERSSILLPQCFGIFVQHWQGRCELCVWISSCLALPFSWTACNQYFPVRIPSFCQDFYFHSFHSASASELEQDLMIYFSRNHFPYHE